jgi:hypothetical protein
MLLILQMINDSQGKVDRLDFAKRLYNWMQYGFKELGDYGKGRFNISRGPQFFCILEL